MSWRDEVAPGDVIQGHEWSGEGDKLTGIVLTGDDGDNTIMIAFPKSPGAPNNPKGDSWDTNWVKQASMTDLSDSEVGRELRAQFPVSALSPEYIFIVIRPSRKITTYANLDALLSAETDTMPQANGALALKTAAAEAIADPETDIKLHPTRNVFLRFTQVEGA